MDTESCGGGIRFLAPTLFVWGYVGIYRRKKYARGATRGPRGRGRALGGRPHPRDRLFCSLEQGPSLLGLIREENHVPKRIFFVWTPFDILFLRNTEIGKKQQFWAGPPVNRLVPKIIKKWKIKPNIVKNTR